MNEGIISDIRWLFTSSPVRKFAQPDEVVMQAPAGRGTPTLTQQGR
jgi:hypothetical protein